MAENGDGDGNGNVNGDGNGGGRLRRTLALNNQYNLRFEPTHEILAFQVLLKRVQRDLRGIPSFVLCYFRDLVTENFFQREDFHRRTVDFYFCKRRMPGFAAPVGWTPMEGPTTIENDNYNDGVFYGTYATYHKNNTTITYCDGVPIVSSTT